MKLHKKISKVMLLAVAFILLSTSLSATVFASSGGYHFGGLSEDGSQFVIEGRENFFQNPAVFTLSSRVSNDYIRTYCAEWGILIEQDQDYKVQTLASFTSNADKVRAVMFGSYPFISVEVFRAQSGITGISKADLIAATQLAIWHYTDGIRPANSSHNRPIIINAYNYLINLKSMSVPHRATITISTPEITVTGRTAQIKFVMSANTDEHVDLNYQLLGINGFREVLRVVVGNTTEVTLAKSYSNINLLDRFECAYIKVWGTQNYRDAVVLISEQGSQPMITTDITTTVDLQTQCIRLPRYREPIVANEWKLCVFYNRGSLVAHNGSIYSARFSHISFSRWLAPNISWVAWDRIQ